MRAIVALIAMAVAASCQVEEGRAADKTITANAESQVQWTQKLDRFASVGASLDSATGILEAAGFQCFPKFHDGNAICNKYIGKDLLGPTYHWRVDFWVAGGRITKVRGSFDHNRG